MRKHNGETAAAFPVLFAQVISACLYLEFCRLLVLGHNVTQMINDKINQLILCLD